MTVCKFSASTCFVQFRSAGTVDDAGFPDSAAGFANEIRFSCRVKSESPYGTLEDVRMVEGEIAWIEEPFLEACRLLPV